MAARQVSKNNVIAGAFLVASLVLAIFVSAIVSGARERLIPTREYVVRFTLAEGAAGLKAGSKVTLGGFKVGRVKDIAVVTTPDQPALDARILVRSGITLFENAMVFLERPLLGSGSEINITSVGMHRSDADFQGQTDQLESGEIVAGHIAPPAFLAQAGYGPQQAEKVRIIIDQVADLSSRLEGLVERIDPQIDPTIEAARAAVDDISAIAAEFREKTPGWTSRIDSLLASTDDAAARIGPIVDDARQVVSGAQAALDDGRPRLSNILASAESAADKIDNETIDTLNKTLRTADTQVARAGDAVADASEFLKEQMPALRRMIGNFRLASDQLKLVTVEIRRNPWRLLYRPETKELEAELLYDAARAYAEAVSDLRAASESLEAAAATPDPGRTVVDRESLESLKAQIDEAFLKYQEAERVFLQRVVDQSK
jgi:ABC-type transporter Mla subunit MlaD